MISHPYLVICLGRSSNLSALFFCAPSNTHKKFPSRFLFCSFEIFPFLSPAEAKKGKSSQRRQMLKRIDHFRPLPFQLKFNVVQWVNESEFDMWIFFERPISTRTVLFNFELEPEMKYTHHSAEAGRRLAGEFCVEKTFRGLEIEFRFQNQ